MSRLLKLEENQNLQISHPSVQLYQLVINGLFFPKLAQSVLSRLKYPARIFLLQGYILSERRRGSGYAPDYGSLIMSNPGNHLRRCVLVLKYEQA